MSKGWQLRPLREIADLKAPRKPTVDPDKNYPFVPMACIDEVTGLQTTYELVRGQNLSSSKTRFLPGDILFAKITPCVENGKVSLAPKIDTPIGFATTEVYRIGPGPELEREFLLYFLRSPGVRKTAEASMTGSTGRQRVPRAFLESLEVPLPPLDEQRRVVARLERALAQAGRIANELHELTEPLTLIDDAALRQTFSQVAGPTSKIEDILIEGRYGSSKKADTTPRGVPILRIPNIVQGRIDLSALKYLPLQDGELARLRLEPGDILVCRTNGSRDLVGRAAVFEAEGEYVFASYLIRIRVDPDRADPKFVSAFMNSPQGRDQILRVVRTSAGQYNLNSTAIKNLRLPLPSLAEQHAAVERLERVDAAVGRLLSQHGEARTTLDLALSSLLDAAYRGDS